MLKLANILKPHELIGLCAGLLLAGIIYAALIHPSIRLMGLEDEAAGRRNAAEKELGGLRSEYQQLQVAIVDRQRRLKELGGSPPLASQRDRQIAQVTSLAKDCGVKVDLYSPIETLDQEDHQAVLLQFAGRTSYRGLIDYFRKIESDIDFVDITHFSVAKVQKDGVADCQLSWSLRVNGMRPDKPGSGKAKALTAAEPSSAKEGEGG